MPWKVPVKYRITEEIAGKLKRMYGIDDRLLAMWIFNPDIGEDQGFFFIPNPNTMKGFMFLCKASCADAWEHVSVTIPTEKRCPTWPEMCFIKSFFWDDTDTVVQFHPPKSEYVNNSEFCLHLWKPKGMKIQLPPSFLVGFK